MKNIDIAGGAGKVSSVISISSDAASLGAVARSRVMPPDLPIIDGAISADGKDLGIPKSM